MSLVNSFINQIGRELGRDVYRSVTASPKRNRNKLKIIDSQEPIYDQVINFELLADDVNTFRHLVNLVEKAEHVDHKDFEWQNLFYQLDNKIDFCKDNLSSDLLPQLNNLDEINAINCKKVKEKHVNYIETIIANYRVSITKYDRIKVTLAFLLSFFGLRPSYYGETYSKTIVNILYLLTLGSAIYFGFLTYFNPRDFSGNLPNETIEDLARIQSVGKNLIIIATFLYLVFLYRGARKILNVRSEIENDKTYAIKFENYKNELLK